MRIVVSREQLFFFERFGSLYLENVFSEQDVDSLISAAEREILTRCSALRFNRLEDGSLLYGRDMSITSPEIRKLIHSFRLAEVAHQLCQKRPLRFGFDQMWRLPFIPSNVTLEGISSVSSVTIGVIIALDTIASGKETVFPLTRGSVTFVSPTLVLNPPQELGGRFLVLAYTSGLPQYRLQPSDPQTHELKKHGYVFGDILKETTHPVLYR